MRLRPQLLVHASRGTGGNRSSDGCGVHLPPPPLSAGPHRVDASPALPLAPVEAHKWGRLQRAHPFPLFGPQKLPDDAILWRARMPMDLRSDVDLWLTYLLSIRL
jgi:hypothetical protein